MRIYIAASLNAKEKALDLAKNLVSTLENVEITSSWLTMETGYGRDDSVLCEAAMVDWNDIRSSHIVIQAFTSMRSSGGGADTELGIALALNKPVFILGDRKNIFHWMVGVFQCDNVAQLKDGLKAVMKELEDGPAWRKRKTDD